MTLTAFLTSSGISCVALLLVVSVSDWEEKNFIGTKQKQKRGLATSLSIQEIGSFR